MTASLPRLLANDDERPAVLKHDQRNRKAMDAHTYLVGGVDSLTRIHGRAEERIAGLGRVRPKSKSRGVRRDARAIIARLPAPLTLTHALTYHHLPLASAAA